MTLNDELADLLKRARELRARGRDVSAEDLCADCPELLPHLRRLLAAASPIPSADADSDSTADTHADRLRPTGVGPAPAVPGYEVLGLLGHGGMGVVYRARHQALGRTVALKVIRAGDHAGPDELARFKAEAEAVARLSHPNIVQVYEVGESDGLPFFALEYVEGDTLEGRLKAGSLPPREAARLIEALAGAVHLAHSRNIVHRDLKPANVLLAACGVALGDTTSATPLAAIAKITDFGLARRLDDESGQTQTGAIVGTPAYMAPEQAAGQAAGPTADVWALGTILYECLTGRPSFAAASTLDTLDQVRHREPASPAQVNRQVPRDLETICLKCLRKEPEKRYGSAQELADDLGRFLRGEPIAARPVGSGERLLKWARRRPAVAILLVALLLLVGGGGGLTGYLFLRARDYDIDRARREQDEDEKAERQRREDQNQHHYEDDARLVEGWAGALSLQPGSLQPAEREALWALTGANDDVKRLFFERMLTQPVSAQRLGQRAEWAVRAGVGLDIGRRDALVKLVNKDLGDDRKDARLRRACAELTLALSQRDPEQGRPVCLFLVEDMRQSKDLAVLRHEAALVRRLTACLERDEAAKVCESAATVLLNHLGRSKDKYSLNLFLSGLFDVVAALPPGRATELRGQALLNLVALVTRDSNFGNVEDLAPVLTRATDHVSPDHAGQAFSALLPLFDKLGVSTASIGIQQTLDRLVGQLPAAVADKEGWGIIDRWTNMPKFVGVNGIIDPATENAVELRILDERAIFDRLAMRMTSEGAARCAEPVLKKLSELPPNVVASTDLLRALLALSDRLPPEKADDLRTRGSKLLRDKWAGVNNPAEAQATGEMFTMLIERLPPEESGAVCRALQQKMARTPILFGATAAGAAFAAAGRRMSAADAARDIPIFLKELLASHDAASTIAYAEALAAQGERLQPEQATQAAEDVQQKIKRIAEMIVAKKLPLKPEQASIILAVLTEGLAHLLKRVPPEKVTDLAGRTGGIILDQMASPMDVQAFAVMANALASLLERVPPEQAGDLPVRALGLIAGRIARAKDLRELNGLQLTLMARLAERLSPPRADALSRGPVHELFDTLTHAKDPELVGFVAQALALLAEHLPPDEANKTAHDVLARIAATPYAVNFFRLNEQMERVAGEEAAAGRARIAVLQAWARLPGRLTPEQTAELAPALLEALDRSESPRGLVGNARIVGRLSSGLTPQEAGRAAAVVLERLGRTEEPGEPILQPASSINPDITDQPGWSEHLKALSQALVELAERAGEQTLVDLMKRPDCVRRAADLLRGVLAKRLGTDFADSWEMADWLRRHRPDLDLDSLPQRLDAPQGKDAR
jgi:hypothetical protein